MWPVTCSIPALSFLLLPSNLNRSSSLLFSSSSSRQNISKTCFSHHKEELQTNQFSCLIGIQYFYIQKVYSYTTMLAQVFECIKVTFFIIVASVLVLYNTCLQYYRQARQQLQQYFTVLLPVILSASIAPRTTPNIPLHFRERLLPVISGIHSPCLQISTSSGVRTCTQDGRVVVLTELYVRQD